MKVERFSSEVVYSKKDLEVEQKRPKIIKFSQKQLLKADNLEEISKNKGNNNFSYTHYKISPKNFFFDIVLEKNIYFFVGRNIDNSIKIYEVELNKGNKGKLIYNIQNDNFVSCIHKKDNHLFFTGHKNGKLFEWKITYELDKYKKKY